MKPVTSANTCPPVEEEPSREESHGKNWGSCANLNSVPTAVSPPSIPRSPSLPSLRPSKLNDYGISSVKKSTSHITSTPQQAGQQKKPVGTPSQNNSIQTLNYSKVGVTPQMDTHSKLGQTPQQKNIFSTAKYDSHNRLNSTTRTGLQHDLLSTSKLSHTPQHGSQLNNKLFSRAPLQPITPRQQPLSSGHFLSSSKVCCKSIAIF